MPHKPDVPTSFTEQLFRIGGYATLVIGALFVVAGIVAAKYAPTLSPGEDVTIVQGFAVGYGSLIGFLVMLGAPVPFAIAEVLGRLRRQEERELVRDWEVDRAESERAMLAARAKRAAATVTTSMDERD